MHPISLSFLPLASWCSMRPSSVFKLNALKINPCTVHYYIQMDLKKLPRSDMYTKPSLFHNNSHHSRLNTQGPNFLTMRFLFGKNKSFENDETIGPDLSKNNPVQNVSEQDWEDLIMEFEARANAFDQNLEEAPNDPQTIYNTVNDPEILENEIGRLNPKMKEHLPLAESAFAAGVILVLWQSGRQLYLDSLIVLFYPLPALFVAMRWHKDWGLRTLCAASILILIYMGPLYFASFLNLQVPTITLFILGLWYHWPWYFVVPLAAFFRAMGLALNASIGMAILPFPFSLWRGVYTQAGLILKSMHLLFLKVTGGNTNVVFTPSETFVKVVIAGMLGTHGLLHCGCTWIVSILLLHKLRSFLKKPPKLYPAFDFIDESSQRGYMPQRTKKKYDDGDLMQM